MMHVQPLQERTVLRLKTQDNLRVMYGRVDFQPVSDNASIAEQPIHFLWPESGHFCDLKAVIGFSELNLLMQYGCPAQACLVNLEDQPAKQFIVVQNRESICRIVINPVHMSGFVLPDRCTIGTRLLHLRSNICI